MRKAIEAIELAFRNVVAYPLLRLFFRNPVSNTPLELSRVRKLLILRYDRLGDMIVTTPVFRNLKRHHPGLYIGVFTSSSNAELIQYNTNVDSIYILHTNWVKLLQEILRARKDGYDVVLNFIFNRTTSGGILANLIAPHGYKVGQGADKYQFYFNRLLKLPRTSEHMVETLAYYIEQVFALKIQRQELAFEIFVDDVSKRTVNEFLSHHLLRSRNAHGGEELPYLVFNLSATEAVRKISVEQAKAIAVHLSKQEKIRTVVIAAPNDDYMKDEVRRSVASQSVLVYPEHGQATLLQIAALIGGAVCVITPDTSIIHFASAMQTPVLGFFTPLQGMHEWLPYKVNHSLVTAEQGRHTSSISHEKIIMAIDSFLSSLTANV
ncbi:MAG: glycosyltransferase family 9 protein [Ignavibacteriales bacterium]|nr:glycosyltransferase family 9 protein [Ignavibacteriales bacterium]